MINDLISRAAAIARIDKCVALSGIGLEPVMAVLDVKALISVLPAVNAAPVVHGEWVEEPDRVNHYHCSNCGVVWGITAKAMKYCPNCATKMMNSHMWEVEGAK